MRNPSKKQLRESAIKKMELFERAMRGEASTHELVKMSLDRGMISQEQYEDFLRIEREYGD
ncbi:hypothetical protein [Estrella lausannensis]|uniref:Antitoxin VbhA domain-containing protein n=1 Tax=Estrella lausannensis TaxID=483423 RepID=A0A0H5E8C2_9BACT|nr:hypothetical protein [Estrella lausannensis]CRX39585.1 hypothetical protein ELAC_p0008 [Estrella lausannensis]